jgi:hypothetical protein
LLPSAFTGSKFFGRLQRLLCRIGIETGDDGVENCGVGFIDGGRGEIDRDSCIILGPVSASVQLSHLSLRLPLADLLFGLSHLLLGGGLHVCHGLAKPLLPRLNFMASLLEFLAHGCFAALGQGSNPSLGRLNSVFEHVETISKLVAELVDLRTHGSSPEK